MITMLRKHFKRWLLQGLIIVLPIALTGIILYQIVVSADLAIAWLLHWLPWQIPLPVFPGLGILSVVVILLGVGALTESWIVNNTWKLVNWTLSKVPFIRYIYSTIYQVVEAIIGNKQTFSRVVLVQYPRVGIWSLGFVTSDSTKEVADKVGEQLVNIFIPTTPNPTSGFYLMCSKTQIKELKMTPEEAFRLIISAGIVQDT